MFYRQLVTGQVRSALLYFLWCWTQKWKEMVTNCRLVRENNLTKFIQEVGNDLSVCVLNIVPKASSLPSLLAMNLMKVEIQIFQTVTWPHLGDLTKGSCLGASYNKSAPCLVWCSYIFCRWIYVFYLSRDPTRPLHWGVMYIYGWELLLACHHLDQNHESFKYVLPLKNWVNWITSSWEKTSQPQKCTF